MKILTVHNGCESNLVDSENSKSKLLLEGNSVAENKKEADLIVFHACTFSQQKEEESTRIINELLKTTSKDIVVSGCYLNNYVKNERVKFIKDEHLPGHFKKISEQAKANGNNISSISPFIQISKGCYGSCTFCSIKSVKGIHKSRSINEILKDIEVRSHYETIKLVGEEDAGYGRDIGINLKVLIDEILNCYPKLNIKLGSLNVKILKKFTVEELSLFAYKNIVGNIHIPMQSANNKILNSMRRGYTIEEYDSIYKKLKKLGVKNISSDIIVGFPGESEEDHRKNLDSLAKYNFNFLEVFAYQEREGTKAADLEQINMSVRQERARDIILQFMKIYSEWNNISLQEIIKLPRIFNTNINF